MSAGRRWLVRSLAAAALIAITRPAGAAPAATDPGAAEVLFQKARAMMEQGDKAGACPIFAESYRLDPAPGTLLNIAECSRSAGKTATAWSQFLEAARDFRRKNDERRAAFADEQAKKLEPELAFVVIKVERAAPDQTVQRNGAPISTASLDTKLPMDPGTHEVVAQAKGRLTRTLTFRARARETASWLIPELEVAPEGSAGERPSTAALGWWGPQRIAGFAVGGAGLAALAIGGIFVGVTAASASELESLCPAKRCTTEEGKDALDRAELHANVANGMLISGGLIAAAGLIVILTAPSPDPDAVVWLVPGPGELAVRGTF